MKVILRRDYRLFKFLIVYPDCSLNFFYMNERMVDFITHQRVVTICCVDAENHPYCFSCFYVFDEEKKLFYFKSGSISHHSKILQQNPVVAGTIQPDKLNPLAIKGIQFTGQIVHSKNELCLHAAATYHKRYPFALSITGDIWMLQPLTIKMTDNTLNFGKKLHWQSNEVISNF